MLVTIHQPTYIPYLGFFNKILHSDVFIIYDTAQFVRGGFNNRNKLRIYKTSNTTWLTVPINSMGFKSFKETFISENKIWRKKHWKTIVNNYGKSKYFDEIKTMIEDIYVGEEFKTISELNTKLIKVILRSLNYKGKIYLSSEMDLDFNLKNTEAIIEMVKKVGSDKYLSGKSGKNYLDLAKFKKENMKVFWQDFTHPEYNQLGEGFIPCMGIYDLLFNEGLVKSRDIILNSGGFEKNE